MYVHIWKVPISCAILPDLLVLPMKAEKQIEENDLDSSLRCREVVRTGFHLK